MRRFADIVQAGEQVPVKHLFPERAIEALDIGILLWVAWLDMFKTEPCRAAQCIQGRYRCE